jgi:hypothetical protein
MPGWDGSSRVIDTKLERIEFIRWFPRLFFV